MLRFLETYRSFPNSSRCTFSTIPALSIRSKIAPASNRRPAVCKCRPTAQIMISYAILPFVILPKGRNRCPQKESAPALRFQSNKTERQARVCEFLNRGVSTVLYRVVGFRPKYDEPAFWPEQGDSVHRQQAFTLSPQKMQRTFAVPPYFLQ